MVLQVVELERSGGPWLQQLDFWNATTALTVPGRWWEWQGEDKRSEVWVERTAVRRAEDVLHRGRQNGNSVNLDATTDDTRILKSDCKLTVRQLTMSSMSQDPLESKVCIQIQHHKSQIHLVRTNCRLKLYSFRFSFLEFDLQVWRLAWHSYVLKKRLFQKSQNIWDTWWNSEGEQQWGQNDNYLRNCSLSFSGKQSHRYFFRGAKQFLT